jgi:hypothetical protein
MKTILSLLVLFIQVNAQPVLYPLHSGDIWQYKYSSIIPVDLSVYTYRVGLDTITGGNSYKVIFSSNYITSLERQNGDSVFLYQASMKREVLFFNFSKSIGDTISSTINGKDTMDIVLTGKFIMNYFGVSRRAWSFYVNPLRGSVDIQYTDIVVDSLGIVGRNPVYGDPTSLVGAVINGKTYGNVVGIHHNVEHISNDFELLQNFPNPFNPTTTISFSLPSRSFVSLKVFDLLGKEVATIISEEMPVGKYSKQWNAANVSSGVYFYRLQAGTFTEIKKLVLLR